MNREKHYIRQVIDASQMDNPEVLEYVHERSIKQLGIEYAKKYATKHKTEYMYRNVRDGAIYYFTEKIDPSSVPGRYMHLEGMLVTYTL